MAKLSFLAGAAVGYVLGAKAGRHRYEQIKASAGKVWSSETVQARVGDVAEAARTKAAPFVADKVGDVAKAASKAMRDRGRGSPDTSATGPRTTSGSVPTSTNAVNANDGARLP
jgi:hypothetical protein